MKRLIALRGMVDFRCLGAECEDACCGEWTVPVDEGHYHKIKRALLRSGEPADRRAFEQGLVRTPPSQTNARGPDRGRFAVLGKDAAGFCQFLDGGLCSLHARFGEDVLGDACATYPRQLADTGERLELGGALSCPEVARRILLAEDATDLVPAPDASAGRAVVSRRFGGAPARLYDRAFDDVRGTMIQLAGRSSYPIASRLFFMVWFAHETSGILRADEAGASADAPEAAELLARALAGLGDPALLDVLDARLRKAGHAAESPVALAAILHAVLARLDGRVNATFARAVGEALGSYAGGGVSAAGEGHFRLAQGELYASWRVRRMARAADAVLDERLELYLQNYLKQFWLREWYVFSPDLGEHVYGLLARVAILRFLFCSQPRLDALPPGPPAERIAAVDRLAVEVFYSVARAFEHNDAFLAALASDLRAALPTLAQALPLILL